MTPQPLCGLTVLDLGQYISAPLAAQNLADLGAEVIKIEPPHGEQARTIGVFGACIVEACNRGKSGMVLDLTTEEGRAELHGMLVTADVLVHNFLPRTAAKLGLEWPTLSAAFPHLICGVVSGFGRQGPNAGTPGLDIMAQAEFGIMGVTGEADREPQRAGFTVADVLASHTLTSGILAAVIERSRTGRGVLVETSLMEATVHAMSAQWAEYSMLGEPPRRKGNGQAQVAPAADVITVQDADIVVSAYTDAKWANLCRALDLGELTGDPRFADNVARVANRRELLAALSAALGDMTADHAITVLREAGIVCGRIRTIDEMQSDPDLLAAGLLIDVDSPDGRTHSLPALPFVMDGHRPRAKTAAPGLANASVGGGAAANASVGDGAAASARTSDVPRVGCAPRTGVVSEAGRAPRTGAVSEAGRAPRTGAVSEAEIASAHTA